MAVRISGFTTTRPNMAGTRTYTEFMKFLGEKPTRLGIVAKLYDQYTATHLTEALMNTYTKDSKKGGFQSVNSFVIEWNIEVNKIHKVQILAMDDSTGANASEIKFYFPENYYQKYDTFIEERSRQQFIVVAQPQRISDTCWMVCAQINDNDYDSSIDSLVCKGAWTRFITNAVPELHDQG